MSDCQTKNLERIIEATLGDLKKLKIKQYPYLCIPISTLCLFDLEKFRVEVQSMMEKETKMPMYYSMLAIYFSITTSLGAILFSWLAPLFQDKHFIFIYGLICIFLFWIILSVYIMSKIKQVKKYARMMELYSKTLGLLDLLIEIKKQT